MTWSLGYQRFETRWYVTPHVSSNGGYLGITCCYSHWTLIMYYKCNKARDHNMSTLSCGPMSNSICHLFTTKIKRLNPLVFQPKIKSQTQLLPSFLICSAITKVELNFDHLSVVIANACTMWNKVEDSKLCPLFMDLDHKNTFLNHSNVFTINNKYTYWK